ncbi:MAG: sporulation transcriptional regulator SpoIIID [Clostridia bacterium]|nr:sporulation transcriptional regulator SpoIIID [Clostridia bacterium]
MTFVNIEKRAFELANYVLDNKSTIRNTAKYFLMAKSTVHYDLSYRLKKIDYPLYLEVAKLLQLNFNEKHLRGGQATKNKYKKQQKTSIFSNKC